MPYSQALALISGHYFLDFIFCRAVLLPQPELAIYPLVFYFYYFI